jgi:hypothetical protein
VDTAYGISMRAGVSAPGTSPLFWYRQSPDHLETFDELSRVTPTDPPPVVSQMVEINFDAAGRLILFKGVPYQEIARSPSRGVDWTPLFEAAGLDPKEWTPAAPQWTPLAAYDHQAAWTGSYRHAPTVAIQIDAAAFHGQPVQFEMHGPWSTPQRDRRPDRTRRLVRLVQLIMLWAVALPAAFIAAHQYRRGRGDLRGSTRLALFSVAGGVIAGLLSAPRVGAQEQLVRAISLAGSSLASGALVWILYFALEPIVRRRWPQSLISWTRLLNGGIRDPIVGGHVLLGTAAATLFALVFTLVGTNPNTSASTDVLRGALGPRLVLATVVQSVSGEAIGVALGMLFVFFLVRAVFRSSWLAGVVVVAPNAVLAFVTYGWAGGSVAGVALPFIVVLLARYGPLPFATVLAVGAALSSAPLTTDLSAWYAPSTITAIVVVVVIALWSFRTALGGRPLLRADLLDA